MCVALRSYVQMLQRMKLSLAVFLLPSLLHAVDFDRDVRALLQERCVACHGAKKQKGELRLDARVHAFKGGHAGPAVVAGRPEGSPLFQRITSMDEDERMPPEGAALSARQVSLVREWIESGAPWPENAADKAALTDQRLEHWSVQPVRRDFPVDASIDGFIEARLRENGLTMSPAADARTLSRRLHFDLLGLPPPGKEGLLPDASEESYARLVDMLLASPHFGERQARHWLDIVHYADTHGFERDQLRPNAWRYRDYVIDAFNAGKPYDEFLREQIAGDVLPRPAIAALGFLSAGPWDFVGQVETRSDMLRRAARALDLDDMVTQTLTATMGITINCARCHDHKLDPITQEEYYRLWAVFAGVKRQEREVDPAESGRVALEKVRMERELAQKRTKIIRLAGEGIELARLIPETSGIDLRHGTITKQKLNYHRDIQANRLQKVENVPGVRWVFVPDGRGRTLVDAQTEVKGIPATSGHFWDTIANRPLNAQVSTMLGGTDFAAKGHTMLAMHANSGITLDLAKLREQSGLKSMRLTGLLGFGTSKEAVASRADFTVFVDAGLKFQKLRLRKDETLALDVEVPAGAKTLSLLATDGGDGIGSDLLFIGDAKLVPETAEARLGAREAVELKRLREEAAKLEKALQTMPEPAKVYAVVSDSRPPVIKVQRRGNPEDEAQEVTPGALAWARHAPAAFGDQKMPEAQRRLALANWITHPDNPLTARVMVNRLWHHHFGRGLVATPSDFGLGGDRPSHPELLDFLARELMTHRWNLKHVHKLIVMSRAYRQRSEGEEPRTRQQNAAAPLLDSANRLLWRQNPRRLDAETLRDTVLAVSGTLNLAQGGPGYRDFNYTEAYAPIYDYITPDKPELWRRSIYRFVVRTTPHQFMTTLDCPDPANLTPARAQTTTALQALTLSNNEFMLQQARHLAARAKTPARVFELCFQRDPTQEELEAAEKLDLFSLCRMLLNANEFVYVD
jgi:hypothetical protein